MNYTSRLKRGAFLIASSILLLAACHKSDNSTSSTTLTAADKGGYAGDASKMENNSNSVISIADEAAKTGASNLRTEFSSGERTTAAYPTVTDSISGIDSFLVINFGPVDITGWDGKNRRGEIIIQYIGHYKDSASERMITFNNYFVNDNQLSGIKTVQNEGKNSSGQVWYQVAVNDTLNLGPGNGEITWSGNRTRTWYAGYGTHKISDDVYLIGGTTTLTRADGNTYSFAIDSTSQLYIAMNCQWIEEGTVTITSSSFLVSPHILNYGATANCDDEAQLTIGSHTYNITLP